MNLLKGGGAHYVFPCFEKPNLKTWIELSVAHKGDFHVLTTMPLVDTTNVYVICTLYIILIYVVIINCSEVN